MYVLWFLNFREGEQPKSLTRQRIYQFWVWELAQQLKHLPGSVRWWVWFSVRERDRDRDTEEGRETEKKREEKEKVSVSYGDIIPPTHAIPISFIQQLSCILFDKLIPSKVFPELCYLLKLKRALWKRLACNQWLRSTDGNWMYDCNPRQGQSVALRL